MAQLINAIVKGNLKVSQGTKSNIITNKSNIDVNRFITEPINIQIIGEDAFTIFKESSYFDTYSNDNGVAIITVPSTFFPCYIGNGEIVYSNGSDSFKLYKKSVNDIRNGDPITSFSNNSIQPCYIGNGEIVYRNSVDTFLYKKSVNDTSNGSAIISILGDHPCYVGSGEIVYKGLSYLLKKSVNNASNGSPITTVVSSNPCYIGNGEIVYKNNSNGYLYRKVLL